MLRKMRRLVWNRIANRYFFTKGSPEELCRQEFFYNAFRALSFNGIDGDYVEFGSAGAMTFALAFRESRRHEHGAMLWAFDSFQGLPATKDAKDEHPAWAKARAKGYLVTSHDQFHKLCASRGIPRDAYKVIAGFYEETLPAMSPRDEPSNIALAYIDCDLYSSAKTVLEYLMARLKHGMIIAFDDYFCWSASQISGERRAMLEFFHKDSPWKLVPYMQFGWHGNSFVVEDKNFSHGLLLN